MPQRKPQNLAPVLPTHTPALFQQAVEAAAALLRAGELVAVPTETVYGLAANALDALAVERIFQVKGRPTHNPIIVHVAGIEMARDCVRAWPGIANKLAKAFWPGPLTLILPRASAIPDVVTAGGDTVGVRWPSHPFVQALIRACGFPLAAPSANLSNRLSPTNAGHVAAQIGDRIRLIVDGGQCQVGIESSVLDVSGLPPRLLRPGMIHEEALLAITRELDTCKGAASGILRSPGQLAKHYSPKAPLEIWRWTDEEHLRQLSRESRVSSEKTHIVAHTQIPSGEGYGRVAVIPHDPEAFARALYAELHACDQAEAELIIVEALPETGEWRALADRLSRAARVPGAPKP
jgi:L-threonylcarbamoyladenylate synthase